MKTYICTLVFYIGTVILSLEAEQELVVRLETDSRLIPVSIGAFRDSESGFSKEYIADLEAVFRFDWNHNGMTAISGDEDVQPVYTFEPAVRDRHLKVKVHSPAEEEEVVFGNVYLTGYAEEDRRTVHQLSDKIFEYLFETTGIASTRILYTVRNLEGGREFSDVWESDYDGGNPRQVTRGEGYCVTPEYVPPLPGKATGSFVFVSYQTGQPKIYAAPLKEGKARRLLTLSGNQLMPTIARQRDRIAFISDTTGNPDLFIQDFDPEKGVLGKPRHLYTAYYATQGTPTFSPDGSRICFVSNKSGTPRIYVIKVPPPGTPLKEIQPVLISKFTRGNTAPSWSPDGTKIAYCAKINGIRQIMVYDFLNGIERQLTEGAGNKENPVWAPNSLHLIYNVSDAGACELYLINLKQANAVKITSGKGEKRFPHWEPRTSA